MLGVGDLDSMSHVILSRRQSTFCVCVVFLSIAATTYETYHTLWLSDVAAEFVTSLHARLGLDVGFVGNLYSLAFAGVLDDVTFVGRPGFAFAKSQFGPSVFAFLFPDRKVAGHVEHVGKLISSR